MSNDTLLSAAQRLREFVAYLQISFSKFALTLGTSQAAISPIINCKRPLTSSMIARIKLHYPQLNDNWLATGEGEMIDMEQEQAIIKSYNQGESTNPTTSSLLSVRINALHQRSGRSISSFAAQLGLTSGAVRELMRGRMQILSAEVRDNILAVFPEINPHWLMTGEGAMLKAGGGDTAVPLGRVVPAIQEQLVQVRFFDLKPSASFREFCGSGNEEAEYMGVLPDAHEYLSETNCAFQINGDSMEPQLHSGAKVLCEEVTPTRWHSVHGVVVIAYADRFVIKRIIKNRLAQENFLLLGSDNPDFPEQEYAQLCDIRCMFRAVRVLSQVVS